MRAALTILGVAVGVFVVVVISAAMHGINASVAKDSRRPGRRRSSSRRYPITFEACDGTDDTCKWRRNPRADVSTDDKVLNALPIDRARPSAQLEMSKEVRYKDRVLSSTQVIGYTANWTIDRRRAATSIRAAASPSPRQPNGERVVIINDEMAKQLFGDSDPLDKVDHDRRRRRSR